ncbi:hypothetical protein LHYA1_G007466, partial [Lachnellula hyalina]
MHSTSLTQLMAFALLASPFVLGASGVAPADLERRYVGGGASLASFVARAAELLPNLEARHHTAAQIAAKKAKAGARDVEIEEQIEEREPHHTAAQIAAKKAKAGARDVEEREPHHTAAQIAAKKAKAGARDVEIEEREPHHTAAQIAAKKAKAGARDVDELETREPHHTAAQIAAKKAK